MLATPSRSAAALYGDGLNVRDYLYVEAAGPSSWGRRRNVWGDLESSCCGVFLALARHTVVRRGSQIERDFAHGAHAGPQAVYTTRSARYASLECGASPLHMTPTGVIVGSIHLAQRASDAALRRPLTGLIRGVSVAIRHEVV